MTGLGQEKESPPLAARIFVGGMFREQHNNGQLMFAVYGNYRLPRQIYSLVYCNFYDQTMTIKKSGEYG